MKKKTDQGFIKNIQVLYKYKNFFKFKKKKLKYISKIKTVRKFIKTDPS